VLTAAHCVDGFVSVKVRAGAHNIREDEPGQVVQETRSFIVHPDWSPALAANDLAMVYLDEELIPTG